DDATFETTHRTRTGRVAYRADRLPDRLAAAITRRLEGDRRVRIDLDLRGHTDFERDVWLKALEIPHGEVRPYGWIAAEIGRPKAVRAAGSRYVGSDTTKIYCLPTCRHARRVTDRHRLEFHSAAEGVARGYRACLV